MFDIRSRCSKAPRVQVLPDAGANSKKVLKMPGLHRKRLASKLLNGLKRICNRRFSYLLETPIAASRGMSGRNLRKSSGKHAARSRVPYGSRPRLWGWSSFAF